MHFRLFVVGASALAGLACTALAQEASDGYLAGREPSTLADIPQAPEPGSPRDLADRAIFRQTRRLEGSPRWALAQHDVQLSVRDLMADLSCAAGVSLTPEGAPKLAAVIGRAIPDMVSAYDPAKNHYRRQRPFMRDVGAICVPRSDYLAKSFDYPSGHATWAWTTGLILAELAPTQAAQILRRARAFGESRVVCGVHSASAIEASRAAADTLVAALNADPGFQTDLAAARVEFARLRAATVRPDAGACQRLSALTANTPW